MTLQDLAPLLLEIKQLRNEVTEHSRWFVTAITISNAERVLLGFDR